MSTPLDPEVYATVTDEAYRIALGKAADKRLAWLRNHHLFPSILGRMLGGWTLYRLAGWVQDHVAKDDPLGFDNLDREALMHRLKRFRNRLPPSLFLPRAYLDDLIASADAEIDVLAELNALIRYQKKRLDLLRGREVEMELPIEQQRKEIQTLLELLMRARDTQISLGVTPGMLAPSVNVNVETNGGYDHAQETRLERYLRENPQDVADVIGKLDKGLDAIPGDWHEVAEAVPDEVRTDVPRLSGDDGAGDQVPGEAPPG